MRFPSTRPVAKLAASVALAGTLGLSGGAALAAQDATPVGAPIGPNACSAPTTTAPVAATPLGDVAAATPVRDRAGVPVEDEAVIAEATEAIQNLYVCFNEGQGEAFVALFTEQGRTAAFGEVDPTELAADIEALSQQVQAGEVMVNEVVAFDDGSLAVDYQVTVGKQVLHFRDTLVNQNTGTWLIDGREALLPETELDSTTASVKTSVTDGELLIEVSPSPLANQPAVKLQMTNNTDAAQDIVLLQGGDAASITELDYSNLPEGVTFVGGAHVEAGEVVDTLFEELPEGNYVIAVESADGTFATFDLTIDPPFDPNA